LSSFQSANQLIRMLLVGVPVAMAMIGTIRWLPIGVHSFYIAGIVLQLLAVVAMLYATFKIFRIKSVTMLPAWSAILATGLFFFMIGAGLASPVVWHEYAFLAYPYITIIAVMSMSLTWFSDWLQQTGRASARAEQTAQGLPPWVQEWLVALMRWVRQVLLMLAPLTSGAWIKPVRETLNKSALNKPIIFAGGWRLAITLFVFIVLMVVWLAA